MMTYTDCRICPQCKDNGASQNATCERFNMKLYHRGKESLSPADPKCCDYREERYSDKGGRLNGG